MTTTPEAGEHPPIPAVRLNKLQIVRERVQECLHSYLGFTLTLGVCEALATRIYPLLGKYFCRDDVPSVAQSISAYLQKKLDANLIDALGYQLVARAEEMLNGPLVPYSAAPVREWCPFTILRVDPDVWKTGMPASILSLKAEWGRPAGNLFQKKVPDSWLRGLAYSLGYSRRLPYPDEPVQLTGLRFWAYVQPHEDSSQGLVFMKWEMDQRLRKENMIIIRRRNRLDLELDEYDKDGDPKAWACPHLFEHDCRECQVPASECPASYRRPA